jgi:hypothetical protein
LRFITNDNERMAEWLKAGVCKTLGAIPRRFESGSVLCYIGDNYAEQKSICIFK